MSSSRVWLRQAKSDLHAAECLAGQPAEDLYCQVAAKCQQIVEKSVKAIATELTDRGIVNLTIGFNHQITHYIVAIVAIARNPRRASEKKSVPEHIRQTLQRNRNEIELLMSLAPHGSPNANQLPRNTEYPFHDAQGVLIAPADTGIFQKVEVDNYLRVARNIYAQAHTLVSIADREPR